MVLFHDHLVRSSLKSTMNCNDDQEGDDAKVVSPIRHINFYEDHSKNDDSDFVGDYILNILDQAYDEFTIRMRHHRPEHFVTDCSHYKQHSTPIDESDKAEIITECDALDPLQEISTNKSVPSCAVSKKSSCSEDMFLLYIDAIVGNCLRHSHEERKDTNQVDHEISSTCSSAGELPTSTSKLSYDGHEQIDQLFIPPIPTEFEIIPDSQDQCLLNEKQFNACFTEVRQFRSNRFHRHIMTYAEINEYPLVSIIDFYYISGFVPLEHISIPFDDDANDVVSSDLQDEYLQRRRRSKFYWWERIQELQDSVDKTESYLEESRSDNISFSPHQTNEGTGHQESALSNCDDLGDVQYFAVEEPDDVSAVRFLFVPFFARPFRLRVDHLHFHRLSTQLNLSNVEFEVKSNLLNLSTFAFHFVSRSYIMSFQRFIHYL